ncbi:MAG: TetR-like C-terminal domain-containing protein [Lachnospiraceae bacterium]
METKKGEKMDRRVRKTRAQLRAGLARLMQQKNIKEITVKENWWMRLISNRSTFYLRYTDIYQMLQSIEGELMEDILEAIKEHPLDPGMKEEGYSFAIQLFRILAANKDICASLMGPNGDMAFVEKIEKLVEDAVLPELFTMFPQNVNDIKYAYAFCINGCVGMIKCWLTGDSDDTPEHMAYLTHNIVSEAPRNFAAKVLNSAQEKTTV